MTKNVLIVHDQIPPYRIGFFNKLSSEFVNRGYTCKIIFNQKLASNRRWSSDIDSKLSKSKFDYSNLSNYNFFQRIIHTCVEVRKSDIIIHNDHLNFVTLITLVLMFFLQKKNAVLWIATTHASAVQYTSLKRTIKRLILKRTRNLIVPSFDSYNYVLDSAYPQKPKVGIVRNSISLSVEDNAKFKMRKNNEITFLYVGQFVERKGIVDLVVAFKKVQKVHKQVNLNLIGGSVNELSELTLIENERINVLGYQNSEIVRKYLQSADFLLLPSRYDTWGMVVNEAFASGTPVIISTGCGAARDAVIDDLTGFVHARQSVDDLCNCLEKAILLSDAAYAEMSKRCNESYMASLNDDVSVPDFIKALDDLII